MIKNGKRVDFVTLKVLNAGSAFFQANMNSFIVRILSKKVFTEMVDLVHNKLRSGKISNRVLKKTTVSLNHISTATYRLYATLYKRC